MQLVVPSAVRNAVSAATATFTANSIHFFFILGSPFFSFATESHGISRKYYFNYNFDNFDNFCLRRQLPSAGSKILCHVIDQRSSFKKLS